MLGETHNVTFEAEHVGTGKGPRGKMRTGFEAVLTIQRSDYGMTKYLPDVLGDDVRITIGIEGIRDELSGF